MPEWHTVLFVTILGNAPSACMIGHNTNGAACPCTLSAHALVTLLSPPPRFSPTQDTPPGNVSSRIAVLSDALLDLAFSYVSRSLFNADRLTFGMHMARHLQPGMIKAEEWNFFLGGLCA